MKTCYICVCSPERLNQYKVLYTSLKKFKGEEDDILLYLGGKAPSWLDSSEVIDISPWVEKSIYSENWYTYTSLRPKALLDTFSKGYERVILLGSDTEFFYPPLFKFEGDAYVTLYTFEPYPDETAYPNNWQTIEVGQINADLIGFCSTLETITFLQWLDTILSKHIVLNGKIYLDQGWFSLMFSFLPNVTIDRYLGYNVGNYNMHNRGMHKDNKGVWRMKDNSPLVLFHYAGIEKGKEETISKHQNRYKAEGPLLQFLKDYTVKL